MIGEGEIGQRMHGRHVALDAGSRPDRNAMARRGMARGAGGVVTREFLFERRVRCVAGEAGQAALAVAETGAQGEHERLVTGIPGIAKIGGAAGGRRHAMTGAAEIVELIGGEIPGIGRMHVSGIGGMRG